MDASRGLSKDLGSAPQLECVFNNGSGTWDNNGGLNYFIPAGVPSGLVVQSKTSTSVSLAWTASTDASGIAGYDVYRNGSLVGSPSPASYTDTGLSVGTAYSYTVRARDSAGNVSALSITTSTTGATVTFNETASTVRTAAGTSSGRAEPTAPIRRPRAAARRSTTPGRRRAVGAHAEHRGPGSFFR